jgi:hypothetical protein
MSRIIRGIGIFLSIALIWAIVPAPASAQVSLALDFGAVSVLIGPPALPYYEQPPCPQPNYAWMPGYWGWGPGGYYWVPGTWVAAADPGYYWTPGYWAYNGYNYNWNPGYWGPQVGYYGGVNYGGGYFGNGYNGGRWQGRNFAYNTDVSNVNRRFIRNVYASRAGYNPAYNSPNAQRYSYNGRGGVQARPTASQQAVLREHRIPLTSMQRQHVQVAAGNRNYLARVNNGRPPQLAVARSFAANRRPANYTPVRAQDRQAVRTYVAHTPQQPRTVTHAMQPQTVTHATQPRTVTHAMQPQTVTHATQPRTMVHAAPVQHTYVAPVRHYQAPVQHTYVAPVHQAPVQHTYVAPVRHYQAPVQHTYVAPVRQYRPPVQHVVPVRNVAPARQAAPHPAPPGHDKQGPPGH